MQILRTHADLRAALQPARLRGESIAIVPTMGYLHEGHLSLIRAARQENDIVVATIFVNPTQFGPKEDFSTYPRDEERDCSLLQEAHTDFVFIPEGKEIYPDGHSTFVEPPSASQGWCGEKRPGHFRGVCTVVSILFNLVQPHRGYFGQKDAQQVAVIRQMTRDLHFPIEIIGCPIVREPDGLAMSSRNVYLSPEQRTDALALNQTLRLGLERFREGIRSPEEILAEGQERITSVPGLRLDYLGIADPIRFEPVQTEVTASNIYLGAVYAGNTRLIDNMIFKEVK